MPRGRCWCAAGARRDAAGTPPTGHRPRPLDQHHRGVAGGLPGGAREARRTPHGAWRHDGPPLPRRGDPGDGIGPEVVGAAQRGRGRRRRARSASGRVAGAHGGRGGHRRATARPSATRTWPPAGRPTRCCWAPSAGPAGTISRAAVRPEQALFAMRGGARPLRQPAAGDGGPGAGRRVAPAPGAARRGGPADPAGADRRAVLRQAVGGARHAGRA